MTESTAINQTITVWNELGYVYTSQDGAKHANVVLHLGNLLFEINKQTTPKQLEKIIQALLVYQARKTQAPKI